MLGYDLLVFYKAFRKSWYRIEGSGVVPRESTYLMLVTWIPRARAALHTAEPDGED